MLTTQEMLNKLSKEGGYIISSREITGLELTESIKSNDFCIDIRGQGFIRRPKEYLDLIEEGYSKYLDIVEQIV